MNIRALRVFSGSAGAAIMACLAGLGSVAPAVADVNIGALACQPPFLDQAAAIRWHEHYLINPKGSRTTWVVCPIAFETASLPDRFTVGAFGNYNIPGINVQCYLNVVDIRNQNIPTLNFLNNPGQDMTYRRIMETQNPANTLWSAWTTVSLGEVAAAMMRPQWTPIDPSQSRGPAYWTITVNCELQPGSALNMVSLWPTI
jgi:hypothetical protein